MKFKQCKRSEPAKSITTKFTRGSSYAKEKIDLIWKTGNEREGKSISPQHSVTYLREPPFFFSSLRKTNRDKSNERNNRGGNPRSRSRAARSIQSLACKHHGEPHSTKTPAKRAGTESNAEIRIAFKETFENHHRIHYPRDGKICVYRGGLDGEWNLFTG